MKLVMTLLVRDEADIIRENILYHLNRIVATDNLSVDGTLDVLMDFQSRGLLYVIRETDDNYAQARWVTRMARLACTEFAADWVINSDADEFWWPPAGNLKDMLASVPPEIGSIAAWRGDFLPRPESEGSVFERMIYRETRSTNSLGQPLPPKVMHRAMADVEVGQGNHFLVAPRGVNTAGVQGLGILHFPMRSYGQFSNKIEKGGAAYARNTELPASMGATWRKLYADQQDGRLTAYYESKLLAHEDIERGIGEGRFVIDTRLRDFLRQQAAASP